MEDIEERGVSVSAFPHPASDVLLLNLRRPHRPH